MSVTETVIEPAGPALTTTVRFPGLGPAVVVGTLVVVGAEVVEGTVVVDGVVVVVGAVDVVGAADVLGETDVVGALVVEGELLVVGPSEVLTWDVDVATVSADTGALNATAAVAPSHTATRATGKMNLRLNKFFPPGWEFQGAPRRANRSSGDG